MKVILLFMFTFTVFAQSHNDSINESMMLYAQKVEDLHQKFINLKEKTDALQLRDRQMRNSDELSRDMLFEEILLAKDEYKILKKEAEVVRLEKVHYLDATRLAILEDLLRLREKTEQAKQRLYWVNRKNEIRAQMSWFEEQSYLLKKNFQGVDIVEQQIEQEKTQRVLETQFQDEPEDIDYAHNRNVTKVITHRFNQISQYFTYFDALFAPIETLDPMNRL
jgi:hypothetical protein